MATVTLQKALGAYYTDEPAVCRLVQWAVSAGSDSVLDPSCGDGAFLAAARSRLLSLGARRPHIYGVDINERALQTAGDRVSGVHLVQSDFFDVEPEALPHFDAVVGNPPFIRYQTFNGGKTSKGHLRAEEAGVSLPKLASSWAPFLVHATRFLKVGGRLGMVMPSELGHAMYARDVLRFLLEHFHHVAIEMFRENIFQGLSQSTVLLLCDGYGEPCRTLLVCASDDLGGRDRQVVRADVSAVKSGRFRLTRYLIPEAARVLYEGLAADRRVKRLGDVADVGIGYVTGGNDFFHLSQQERHELGVPPQYLRPALLNLRNVTDVQYRREHWDERRAAGDKVYLLSVPPVPKNKLPSPLQCYLGSGENAGISNRFKCRIREFWYSVPHVRTPDAFLSYMSGEQPLLVINTANLVAPNTVHLVRFERDCDPLSVAVAWRNSLTKLSCEIEGHALGGGLFKLEPSEAENVLVLQATAVQTKVLSKQLPNRIAESEERALDLVDRCVLRGRLGLSLPECESLRDAASRMESWRKHK